MRNDLFLLPILFYLPHNQLDPFLQGHYRNPYHVVAECYITLLKALIQTNGSLDVLDSGMVSFVRESV